MTTADDIAHELAEKMLRLRIEVRKLAYSPSERYGKDLVSDTDWLDVYETIRRYEDAQVRDMLDDRDRHRRRKRRIRRDEEKAQAIPTEKRRTSKEHQQRR